MASVASVAKYAAAYPKCFRRVRFEVIPKSGGGGRGGFDFRVLKLKASGGALFVNVGAVLVFYISLFGYNAISRRA